jgi:hypothetical protein
MTMPAEVRRLLGRKPQVAFTIEDREVRPTPVAFTLETAYGSVPPPQGPLDIDGRIRLAKEERAEQTVATMRDER